MALRRLEEHHDFILRKGIADVKIKITADKKRRILRGPVPDPERSAAHEHIILHGVADVMGGMVLELTLVRIAKDIEIMGAELGHGLDFLAVFFGHVASEPPVKDHRGLVEKRKIGRVWHITMELIDEDLFLAVEEVSGHFPEGLSPLDGAAGKLHFPEAGL